MIQIRALIPFIALIIGLCFSVSTARAQTLQIEITNIQAYQGELIVSIYSSKDDWFEKPFKETVIETQNDTEIVSFEVPYGTYAISAYQDVKKNGELDRNFLGIPKEPIAFGNNYKPFGDPNFDKASVKYDSAYKTQRLSLYKVF